jgi:hypothetical protein
MRFSSIDDVLHEIEEVFLQVCVNEQTPNLRGRAPIAIWVLRHLKCFKTTENLGLSFITRDKPLTRSKLR